ncbi:MAG: response regulator [Myxococcota bacterium]
MPCSLVIAEGQKLVRESLRSLVESRGDCVVVGEAGNGRQLVDVCREFDPDIAVVDAQLPELSGVEALREVRRNGARPRFVLLSGSDSPGLVRVALLAGASAFVPKSASASKLLEAIATSRSGGRFFSGHDGSSLRSVLAESPPDAGAAPLTRRQLQVLRLVAEGLSTRQIAEELGVSVKTAQTHRTSLMKKVGAHKASELVRYAIRERIVEA